MDDPIPIRAHLALCLLGFQGEGYSVTFVGEMTKLHRELHDHPERPIRLITHPDRVCRACVHLHRGGCTLGGPEHEAHMKDHDEEVLRRLGLAPDGVYPWKLIKARIASSVTGADLPAICTTCPWLESGVCEKAVDGLRAEFAGPPPTA